MVGIVWLCHLLSGDCAVLWDATVVLSSRWEQRIRRHSHQNYRRHLRHRAWKCSQVIRVVVWSDVNSRWCSNRTQSSPFLRTEFRMAIFRSPSTEKKTYALLLCSDYREPRDVKLMKRWISSSVHHSCQWMPKFAGAASRSRCCARAVPDIFNRSYVKPFSLLLFDRVPRWP